MINHDMNQTYNYLVNLTFCAGSNEPQDVDNKIIIISSEKQTTVDELVTRFNETNKLLDPFNEDSNFPFNYDDGLNIDTLLKGFAQHTGLKVTVLEHKAPIEITIHGYFVIEQWQ